MIYLLEDDDSIRDFVIYTLNSQGMEARGFPLPSLFWQAVGEQMPALVLLDIMLPVRSGTEIVRILRAEKNPTPIMLLTAKSEVEDKIHGLDCGADDYLTKPFSTGELLARIRALTRRKGEVEVDSLHFDTLQLNRLTYSLVQGENSVKLSLKEYQIMEMLLSNPGQILPKERFIEKIWGYESDVEYNNIEVYISFLRKKLTAISSAVQIRTARGIGYFLEKKV